MTGCYIIHFENLLVSILVLFWKNGSIYVKACVIILFMSLCENGEKWLRRKKTKLIKNLPALPPFIVKENVTINLLKNWEEWPDDFNIYLIATMII